MKGFLGLFGNSENQKTEDEGAIKSSDNLEEHEENHEEQKLKLRKEELDVAKHKVDIGMVEFGKEIIEEQQIVNVPVIREEVVIERRSVNEPSEKPIGEDDNDHFSLSVGEEKVDIGKHTIVTGEVTAHKREVEENREIKENIKREEARINKDGNANIVDENEQLH
ncbi:MAG: YsnF/AvaK domain-containing protein [Syntrophomonadaceae bacterium]|nr:YsnF/AvaK domain-containing protein [Syntrophomonadaceae bacterium]MDD3022926.1 YsnF/AvaK domain-containing protein [Syntrophomonadaceae bacterium]